MNISQEELLELLNEMKIIGSESEFLLIEDFISFIQNKINRILESS